MGPLQRFIECETEPALFAAMQEIRDRLIMLEKSVPKYGGVTPETIEASQHRAAAVDEGREEEPQQTVLTDAPPVCPVCGEAMVLIDTPSKYWFCSHTCGKHYFAGPNNDPTGEETHKMIAKVRQEARISKCEQSRNRALIESAGFQLDLAKAEARVKELELAIKGPDAQAFEMLYEQRDEMKRNWESAAYERNDQFERAEKSDARVRELEIIQASLNNDLLRSSVERNELSDKLDVANATIARQLPVVEAACDERHKDGHCDALDWAHRLENAVKAYKEATNG